MEGRARVTLVAKVGLRDGGNYRILLQKLGALDPSLAPSIEGDRLLIPIQDRERMRSDSLLRRLELVRRCMMTKPRRPRSIREALSRELEPSIASKVRRSFDVIGDTVVVSLDAVASLHKQLLVESILSVHRTSG